MSGNTTTVVSRDAVPRRFNKRAGLLAGGVLLVLLAVIFLVFAGSNKVSRPPKGDAKIFLGQAQQLAFEGEYEQAYKAYDAAVYNSGTDDQKTAIYLQKASTASKGKSYDVEIDTADKLLQLRQSAPYYGILARGYEGKGDSSKAVENYKKAISLEVQDKNSVSNASSNTYQSKVDELTKGSKQSGTRQ